MKKAFLLLLSLSLCCTFKAQNPYRAWSVLAGGEAYDLPYDIIETTNGGFMLLGTTNSSLNAFASNHGGADIMLVKYDANGQQLWMKLIGGSQNDVGTAIIQKSDGSFYIAGRTKSTDFDFSSNIGLYDYFLMKVEANGNKVWSKTYGGTDEEYVSGLIELNDGFLISGYSASNDSLAGPFSYGYGDYWFVKTDTSGNVMWTKKTGGSDWDTGPISTLMSNGKIISSGHSLSFDFDISSSKGSYDIWVNELNPSNGSLTAEFSVGGPINEFAAGIVEDNAGNYYICGSTSSTSNIGAANNGALDYYINKYSSTGNRLWSKCFGGTYIDELRDVKYKNGYLYLCGSSDSNDGDIINYYGAEDIWVLKIDTAGNIINNFMFGRDKTDQGNKICVMSNNDIIIVGNTDSGNLNMTPTAGLNDIILIKIGFSGAGIQQNNKDAISVSPNPSNGKYYLQNWDNSAYEIIDISGKQVFVGNAATIDIRHLQAGIYFLRSGTSTCKLVNTNN